MCEFCEQDSAVIEKVKTNKDRSFCFVAPEDKTLVVGIVLNTKKVDMSATTSFDIDFCPKCGRDLNGEEN